VVPSVTILIATRGALWRTVRVYMCAWLVRKLTLLPSVPHGNPFQHN
jgi:hypothetical protein